jgi:hypothetical protein
MVVNGTQRFYLGAQVVSELAKSQLRPCPSHAAIAARTLNEGAERRRRLDFANRRETVAANVRKYSLYVLFMF